jgi:alanyl-tRNA synthetase
MMSVEKRAHTALHVLKGAVVRVLGAKWTAGVSANGSHGRLTVQFDRKPTEEEISKIQEEINKKIDEDAAIEIHEMERSEAEKRWGDLVYDLFPLPASITRLSVFNLPGWNVNACNKEHTKTTGEIGHLRINKTRFRAKKGLLEISFDIE